MATLPKDMRKKWQNIIAAFQDNHIDALLSIQRGGSRGRIFHVLIEDMLKLLAIPFAPEPVFDHVEINPWYIDFVGKHNLKLHTHGFYNPDFLLEDGTWFEISLSEKKAYQKLFRYGHQAPQLRLIWLDEDDGLHKSLCQGIKLPNAEVISVESYYAKLDEQIEGKMLIEKLEKLKKLKGVLL